ncbi:hypothetical protein ITP53_08995 [Nonomuraea sp. K274]|uniref:Uncharacterized protein n=1 Tax=Nonomuraea cypriaca TaxID=1187855 RepID=A0A931A431_9ACTN|nr:hypothetical protein [Nonomuraea cypriaca]MBF8185877.1 hypothetical protein [Nonomuraea cypriaca]
MPGSQHEGLVSIGTLDFGHTAKMLLSLFDLPISESGEARLASPDLSETVPASYHADAALLFGSGKRKVGVILETQRGEDGRKHYSWPNYITSLRARERCRVYLVVICPNSAVAEWAAKPIFIGHPEMVLIPLVIGPDNTPVITDVAKAVDNIGLAVISTVTHRDDPSINLIIATLTHALSSIDPKLAQGYAEYVVVALSDSPAQKEMERLMSTKTYPYMGEYSQSLIDQGKAEGEAKAVLLVLGSRGVSVGDRDRERIVSCTDLAILEGWVERAAFVTSVEELFA